MTERAITKGLLVTSAILDALILAIFLLMPRSGMEEMATAFLLYPLVAIRVVIAIISLVLSVRRRNWKLGVYTVLAMAILAWFWVIGASLKPTYEPLHEVLRQEARVQAKRLNDYLDKRAYDSKRAEQSRTDPEHAQLCDRLTEQQDLQALEALLDQDVDRPCATYYGNTVSPLLHAIIHTYGPWSGGSLERPDSDEVYLVPAARQLLNAGADPNTQDQYGNTPLHYALVFQNEALLDDLLANGACVLVRNDLNESPLGTHSAPRLKKRIKTAASDPNMLSHCPDTVLPDRESGADPRDSAPSQPPDAGLLSALRSGRLEVALAHLQRGADPNAIDREGSSFDAALRNCRENNLALIQLLIDAGADINLQNQRGETALKIAVHWCREAAPYLLEQGADPTIADRRGDTALHDLVRVSPARVEVLLNQLLAAGADINRQNHTGQTPLIKSAYGSATRPGTAIALMNQGADLDLQDGRGNTAVHILATEKAEDSAHAQQHELLGELLTRGADLEIRNQRQETPLIAAIDHGSSEFTQQLIDAGADVNVWRARDIPLISTLISCDPEKLEKLTLLVNAGADTSVRSEHGPLPLAQAFYNKVYLICLAPARVLLAADTDPNLQDRNGTAAIHGLATWSGKDPESALTLLLEHGAELDLRNQQGMTALLLAARNGTSIRTIERLLAHGADPAARDDKGNTLLHCAAMNTKEGNSKRLSWLLANGGDPSARNLAGETPLDRALITGNQVLIPALEAL